MVLRNGWEELIHRVLSENGKVAIVSVGWSGEFIHGCLQAAMQRRNPVEGKEARDGNIVESIDIRANEIIGEDGKMSRYFEENGRGGEGGIWTARDKRKVMEDVIREGGRDMEVVYIGDSTTDLECLLSADVGICVRDERDKSREQLDLARTLARLEIGPRWIGHTNNGIYEVDQIMKRTDRKEKRPWRVRDFNDICKSPLFNVITIYAASKLLKLSPEAEISSIYPCTSSETHLPIRCIKSSSIIRNAKPEKKGV